MHTVGTMDLNLSRSCSLLHCEQHLPASASPQLAPVDASFHCLSYARPDRAASMAARFRGFGLDLAVSPGVAHDDPRLTAASDAGLRRLWSATYGHLDMVRAFLAGDKTWGVFCEDDVLLAADFGAQLPGALADAAALDLDLLMLGYMTSWPLAPSGAHPLLLERGGGGAYLGYPADQWGAHLYALSRRGARRALEKFADGAYALASLHEPEKAFSPDWTITKLDAGGDGRGRRALLYPMIAVEDGSDGMEHYGHEGQADFHAATFEANTRGREFV